MKKLYLLRHGEAVIGNPTHPDFDRPLSPLGRKGLQTLNATLSSTSIDLVLCSTSTRTRETFEIIQETLQPKNVFMEQKLYNAQETCIRSMLAEQDDALDNILIVGHNPSIGLLAHSLLDNNPILISGYPTGTLAEIQLPTETWANLHRGQLLRWVSPQV